MVNLNLQGFVEVWDQLEACNGQRNRFAYFGILISFHTCINGLPLVSEKIEKKFENFKLVLCINLFYLIWNCNVVKAETMQKESRWH